MTEHRVSLPEYAKTFLSSATRVHTERVIVMFHRWLLERCMELSAVTGKELQDFLDRPSGKAVKPRADEKAIDRQRLQSERLRQERR